MSDNQLTFHSLFDAQKFLCLIANLYLGMKSDALDMVYDTVDDLLLAGEFEQVKWILRGTTASVADLPFSVLLSVLTITLPWRQQLDEDRQILVDAIRARVQKECPDRLFAMLHGLNPIDNQ